MAKKSQRKKKLGRRKTLLPRHKLFCDEWLKDNNATQAYIRAGYKSNQPNVAAYLLMQRPDVQAYLAKRQEDLKRRLELEQDDVVRGLHGEATFKGEGSSHSARVSAWAHLGKHLGMFEDRLKVTGTIRHEDALEELE